MGAALVAGVAGWGVGRAGGGGPNDSGDGRRGTVSSSSSQAAGVETLPEDQRVAGITWPAVPQRHLVLTVLTLARREAEAARTLLRGIQGKTWDVPSDAGDVSVTLGFGEELARAAWPERAGGDQSLPGFAHDVDGTVRGGDVAIQVCAETAAAARRVSAEVLREVGAHTVLWEAVGYRDASTPQGTTRTGTGFVDGIINPRSTEELAAGVWKATGDGTGRDTYVAYRRMRILARFAALPDAEQEQAVGRRLADGAPLSGGGPLDQVDLFAKSPEGRLLTPLASHARRAHPSNLGLPLMLRRSYAYEPGGGDSGLIFTAFVAEPRTFVATQQRLDEQDDFLANTTADAAGIFFVPAAP